MEKGHPSRSSARFVNKRLLPRVTLSPRMSHFHSAFSTARRTTRISIVLTTPCTSQYRSPTLGQFSLSDARGCSLAAWRNVRTHPLSPALSLYAYPHASTSHRHIERRAFMNSVLTVCRCCPHRAPPRAPTGESRAPPRPAVRCQAALLADSEPRAAPDAGSARLELLLPGRFSLARPLELRRRAASRSVAIGVFEPIQLERMKTSIIFIL